VNRVNHDRDSSSSC